MDPNYIDQFQVALEAYQELQAELRAAPETAAAPALPSIEEVLRTLGPLPPETLFVGTAADGLPILHNLRVEEGTTDRSTGPIAVLGDAGGGKTALLQMLARSLDLIPEAGDIQFGVVTNFPEEWAGLETSSASLGIWPGYHSSARHFLLQLVSWAESFHRGHNFVLLLIDDLGQFAEAGTEVQHDLRYLLMYGPEKGIWPVVTVNADRASGILNWLDYFRTRIFARLERPALAESLAGSPRGDLGRLVPGVQYALQRPNGWLRFWIPALWQERSES